MSLEEQQSLSQEWREIAEKWIAKMEQGESNRAGLLDRWMQDAAGEVAGLDVVDIGCGEGRFSRWLAAQGARVTGIDLCEPFIDYAQRHRVADETYLLGDAQELAMCADASFDLAVSYLTLMDFPDHRTAIRSARRVLKPGGRYIACICHPMTSATCRWHKDESGNKLHFKLDNYFDLAPQDCPLVENGSVSNYHRPLSDYINIMLETGFTLERLDEPRTTPAQLAEWPDTVDNERVPSFMILQLRAKS